MIAEAMRDPETRLKMLNIAECYERLAQRAEDRLWFIKSHQPAENVVPADTKGWREVGLTRNGSCPAHYSMSALFGQRVGTGCS
jgi:hypothetical protein